MPPGSVCITSLLDMTINLQLIMKNHPVIWIRISKAKIVKPDARLIMIENKKSKAEIYVSRLYWYRGVMALLPG